MLAVDHASFESMSFSLMTALRLLQKMMLLSVEPSSEISSRAAFPSALRV